MSRKIFRIYLVASINTITCVSSSYHEFKYRDASVLSAQPYFHLWSNSWHAFDVLFDLGIFSLFSFNVYKFCLILIHFVYFLCNERHCKMVYDTHRLWYKAFGSLVWFLSWFHKYDSLVTGCNPNDLDIWTEWCRHTTQKITDRKQVVCRVVDHN